MSDVICISSDDESDSSSKNNKVKNKKLELKLNFPQKRKSSLDLPQECSGPKKVKEDNKVTVSSNKTSSEESKLNYSQEKNSKSKCNDTDYFPRAGTSKDSDELETKQSNQTRRVIVPQLIVRNKIPIPGLSEDVFEKFLQACEKRKSDESTTKILSNLKKRYSKLNRVDKECEEFRLFLNSSIQKVSNTYSDKFYSFIQEVQDEMKRRIKKPKILQQKESSTKNGQCEITNNENVEESIETMLSKEDMKKVQKLEKTIEKCREKIKELEEREVDFNDEEDSAYLQEDRYKRKLVQLCAMLSDIVDDSMMKREIYKKRLKRKDIPGEMTGIISVDEAILNFVNSGIKKVNKLKHIKNHTAIADYLTVPDYQDILQCIIKCNEEKNLTLSKKKMEGLANTAFKSLLRHLKKQRVQECDDYISSYVEIDTEGDPAIKNNELSEKLQKNKELGDQKLKEIFKLYEDKEKGLSPEDLKEQIDANSDYEEISENELSDQISQSKEDSKNNELRKQESESKSSDESTKIEHIIRVDIHNETSQCKINEQLEVCEKIKDPLEQNADDEISINSEKSKNMSIINDTNKKSVDIVTAAVDDEIEILSDDEPILNSNLNNVSNKRNTDDCIKVIDNSRELGDNTTKIKKNDVLITNSIRTPKNNNSVKLIPLLEQNCKTKNCQKEILHNAENNIQINSPKLNFKEPNKSSENIKDRNNTSNSNNTMNETSHIPDKVLKTNTVYERNRLQTKHDKEITKSQECSHKSTNNNENIQTDFNKINIEKTILKKSTPMIMTLIPGDVVELFEAKDAPELAEMNEKITENKICSDKKSKNSISLTESVVEESSMFIKVKDFAKPPDSWKDSVSPEKCNQNLKLPIQQVLKDLQKPECVDLTNDKDSRLPCTSTRNINPVAFKKAEVASTNNFTLNNTLNFSFPVANNCVSPKNIRITNINGKRITINHNPHLVVKKMSLNPLADKSVQLIPIKFSKQEQNKQLKNPPFIK